MHGIPYVTELEAWLPAAQVRALGIEGLGLYFTDAIECGRSRNDNVAGVYNGYGFSRHTMQIIISCGPKYRYCKILKAANKVHLDSMLIRETC